MYKDKRLIQEALHISLRNMDRIAKDLDKLPFLSNYDELHGPSGIEAPIAIFETEKRVAKTLCPQKIPVLNKLEKMMETAIKKPTSINSQFFRELKKISLENGVDRKWLETIEKGEHLFNQGNGRSMQKRPMFFPFNVKSKRKPTRGNKKWF